MTYLKKSKEQVEKEWAEFELEQIKAFDELLIEKGIKKSTNSDVISDMT